MVKEVKEAKALLVKALETLTNEDSNLDLTGTKTEENLLEALKGEALAHLKYQFYKSKLTDYHKGYENSLDEIIHNEKEHGKIWFKLLHKGNVDDNLTNLVDAMEGETYEHTVMYPSFSRVAEDEGFHEIAELFKAISIIEGNHSKEFKRIIREIEDDYYNTDGYWKCLNCGHIVKGTDGVAPSLCPVCNHPQKYFVRL